MVLSKCLNPYYTGIHLHTELAVQSSIDYHVLILIILEYIYIVNIFAASAQTASVLILIILEYIYISRESWNLSTQQCLNPYYTGIHLHAFELRPDFSGIRVLILIILEYIYIYAWLWKCAQRACLNPYYTGIHLHTTALSTTASPSVLILIILEYIYIENKTLFFWCWRRLNPYYTGIHLHKKTEGNGLGIQCLNPYYTGIHLHETLNLIYRIIIFVLILIILEYIYILEKIWWAGVACLNPYYTGIHLHLGDWPKILHGKS